MLLSATPIISAALLVVMARSRAKRPKKEVSKEVKRASQQKSRLWALFRLTPEELKRIDDFQKKHPIYSLLLGRKLGTDHNHKTGQIRGRLDWRINRAYGMLEAVSPERVADILRALAHYHENHPATLVLGEERFGLTGKAQYKKKMVYGSAELKRALETKKALGEPKQSSVTQS